MKPGCWALEVQSYDPTVRILNMDQKYPLRKVHWTTHRIVVRCIAWHRLYQQMNVEVRESPKIIKFTEKTFHQLISYLLTQLVLHMLSMVIKLYKPAPWHGCSMAECNMNPLSVTGNAACLFFYVLLIKLVMITLAFSNSFPGKLSWLAPPGGHLQLASRFPRNGLGFFFFLKEGDGTGRES